MPNRESNRSSSYQNILLELATSPFVLNDLSSAQGMTYKMRCELGDEKYLDLRERLKARVFELVDIGLTERQKQVLKLSMLGLTQNEIAKQLGINQTSVHKVLRGNIDYSSVSADKVSYKRYGGTYKKLIKLCKQDEQIQLILQEMRDLAEEMDY